MTLSPTLNKNGVINDVITEITPTRGKRKGLTAPRSTPVFIITIENSPLGAASSEAERSDFHGGCLNNRLPSRLPPNFTPMATAINPIAIKI